MLQILEFGVKCAILQTSGVEKENLGLLCSNRVTGSGLGRFSGLTDPGNRVHGLLGTDAGRDLDQLGTSVPDSATRSGISSNTS